MLILPSQHGFKLWEGKDKHSLWVPFLKYPHGTIWTGEMSRQNQPTFSTMGLVHIEPWPHGSFLRSKLSEIWTWTSPTPWFVPKMPSHSPSSFVTTVTTSWYGGIPISLTGRVHVSKAKNENHWMHMIFSPFAETAHKHVRCNWEWWRLYDVRSGPLAPGLRPSSNYKSDGNDIWQ